MKKILVVTIMLLIGVILMKNKELESIHEYYELIFNTEFENEN